MDKKELQDALEVFKKEIETLTQQKEDAAKEEKAELEAKLVKANEDMGKMQEQLDAIAIEQKNAKITKEKSVGTFADELKKQINEEIDNIKGMTTDHKKEVMISVKSFLETDNASVTTGSLLPTPQFDPDIVKAPDRMPFLLDIVSRGVSNSLTIYYTERKTRTDNTAYVAEGVAPSESVLGYATQSATMVNLSSFLKVSNNSLDDIDWLLSEIKTELITLHILKLDATLLTGASGTEGYDGIFTAATAFAAGGDTLAASITPTKYDALMYAINQVRVAKFEPNYIVLHPTDIRDMKLERDGNGAYMLPAYQNVNPSVDGIKIISNTGMTKGSYLVGDFKQAKYWTRKNMELRIWEQNDTDATKQLKTVTLYSRGTLIIPTAKKLAFVKDTFADSITEITHA